MEDIEDLPVETVFNLIKNSVIDLEDFKDWVDSLRRDATIEGYQFAYDSMNEQMMHE